MRQSLTESNNGIKRCNGPSQQRVPAHFSLKLRLPKSNLALTFQNEKNNYHLDMCSYWIFKYLKQIKQIIILISAGEQGAPLHIFPTSAALPCSQTRWASCLGLGEMYNL